MCHLIGGTKYHCCNIPAINKLLESNYEEMSNEPKLTEVLQNDRPAIVKIIKLLKVTEKLGRLKKANTKTALKT